jgi:hypothetical protein
MKKYFADSQKMRFLGSHFSIKCLIQKDIFNDGRPVAISKNSKGNILVTIGGKIDNIYDVVSELDEFLEKLRSHN